MSVINQVLNELEKRGESVPLGEVTIRAIPPRRPSRVPHYTLAATGLLALLAAATWYLRREPAVAPEQLMSPHKAGSQLVSALSDAPTPAASMVLAASAPLAEQSAATPASEAPASKLSFELSVIPLPDSLRARPAQEDSGSAAARKAPARRAHNMASPEAPQTASSGTSPMKRISPRQQAESEFHAANQAAQQGNTEEALAGFQRALRLDPLYHDARRGMVGVLLGAKRNADAENVLQEGLKRDSHETSFAMLLARLQVERDALPLALGTLQKNLPHAGRQPEYHAFIAALLQRQNRHQEAVTQFQTALQLVPGNGVWLMGLGISLQALQRNEDARSAYQRALGSNSLNPQLQEFVQNKLREL